VTRRAFLLAATGWLILSGIYATLIYAQSAGMMGASLSIRVALETTFAPASMSVGVWWISGRLAPGGTSFLLSHVALAVMFASAWTLWMLAIAFGGTARMSSSTMVRGVVPWHAAMGLLLYAVIAAASYAARASSRARDLALAAEHAERLRAQADLAALRAHINPHFLFNTLHSVGELLSAEPAKARDALERLAELFRYTLRLDRERADFVTLEDEWRMIDSYLCLERIRMGDRLCVDASFDDDALSCAVPAFTLQPIVENAIVHGLSPKVGAGTLVLRARESGDRLTIEVRDDGVGRSASPSANGNGLGLRAVRQRLAARHGELASVDIADVVGGGTSVTITLPAETP
jgi:sensor histidine kinase YesM